MKRRSESTCCTRPHIHLLSIHTQYIKKHHLTLLITGTRLAVGLYILHEQYLKNGAPYCL